MAWAIGARAQPIEALFHQGLIFVRVGLTDTKGGRLSGLFLLDTGAQATVIDSRLAAAARLALGSALSLSTPGGAAPARRTGGVTLQLSGGPSAQVNAVVTDLSQTARAMGLPLAGVLGVDFLARFVVRLDYRAGALRLTAPSGSTPPGLGAPIRFDDLPYVAARARRGDQIAQGSFQIDTGSNTAVEFWAPFAAAAFPGVRGAPGEGVGVGGLDATLRGRIDALEVAGRAIADLTVNFADQAKPTDAGTDYAGVIGGPAWAGLALTLDFPARHLALD